MKYYPDLIRRGHVHILQTPLFRVRNKKATRYCYSVDEKEAAVKELKTGVEITRFKGLGEISSNEFVDFIGENMRLDLLKSTKRLIGNKSPLAMGMYLHLSRPMSLSTVKVRLYRLSEVKEK